MKFETFIRQAGYCCPWAFFEANRKVRTGLLAARLGVHEGTIREWRSFHDRGQIGCKDARNCTKETAIAAGKAPLREE